MIVCIALDFGFVISTNLFGGEVGEWVWFVCIDEDVIIKRERETFKRRGFVRNGKWGIWGWFLRELRCVPFLYITSLLRSSKWEFSLRILLSLNS